jgi:hypothetical protein
MSRSNSASSSHSGFSKSHSRSNSTSHLTHAKGSRFLRRQSGTDHAVASSGGSTGGD